MVYNYMCRDLSLDLVSSDNREASGGLPFLIRFNSYNVELNSSVRLVLTWVEMRSNVVALAPVSSSSLDL